MITRLKVSFSLKGVSTSSLLALCESFSFKFKEVVGWRFISICLTTEGLEVLGIFISKVELRALLKVILKHTYPVLTFSELPSDFAKGRTTIQSLNDTLHIIYRAL